MNNVYMNAVETANEKLDLHAAIVGLLYGIAFIQSLPEERQERETMHRMCAIMREAVVPKLALTLWGVETLVGREIDLWPAYGGSGPGGNYTDEEFDHKAAVRAEIKQRQERFEKTGALSDAPPSDVVKFL